jgi:hypothetical protein
MAINFPSTAGQATDGSFTYTVAGITYSWDGSSWSAAGAGASATDRTLFSVTNSSAAGSGNLTYDSNTGVFDFTPPNLSFYLTAEADTLSTVVARGNTTGGNINFGDSQYAYFGTGNDLQISHDGSNSYIREVGVGQLYIESAGTVAIRDTNGVTVNASFSDGTNGQQLYYQGALKFQTTSTGATVTGALTAGGLTYPTSNGTSGQVLTSDGAGNVTWTNGGLQPRTTAQVTTSIANGGTANINLTTPKTYALLSIELSHAAWVTLYTDTSSRTSDAGRARTTDPTPGSGVLTEVITTGARTQLITPGTICFNSAGTGTTYAKVVNDSGATNNITVTLTYVQLES